MRDVQSKTFRDSLHGPFGRIPNERFDLCRRRLVEFLEIVRVDSKDPFLVHRTRGKGGLGDLSRKHDDYLYGKTPLHGRRHP